MFFGFIPIHLPLTPYRAGIRAETGLEAKDHKYSTKKRRAICPAGRVLRASCTLRPSTQRPPSQRDRSGDCRYFQTGTVGTLKDNVACSTSPATSKLRFQLQKIDGTPRIPMSPILFKFFREQCQRRRSTAYAGARTIRTGHHASVDRLKKRPQICRRIPPIITYTTTKEGTTVKM